MTNNHNKLRRRRGQEARSSSSRSKRSSSFVGRSWKTTVVLSLVLLVFQIQLQPVHSLNAVVNYNEYTMWLYNYFRAYGCVDPFPEAFCDILAGAFAPDDEQGGGGGGGVSTTQTGGNLPTTDTTYEGVAVAAATTTTTENSNNSMQQQQEEEEEQGTFFSNFLGNGEGIFGLSIFGGDGDDMNHENGDGSDGGRNRNLLLRRRA